MYTLQKRENYSVVNSIMALNNSLTVISGVTSVVFFKYFWLIHLWIRQHKVVGLVLILKLFYLKNDPGFSEGVSCEWLRMIHWLYESDSNHYLVSDFGGTSQILLTHYKEPDCKSHPFANRIAWLAVCLVNISKWTQSKKETQGSVSESVMNSLMALNDSLTNLRFHRWGLKENSTFVENRLIF